MGAALCALAASQGLVRTCGCGGCREHAHHGLSGYDASHGAQAMPDGGSAASPGLVVYVAKSIITMDPSWPLAKAVLVDLANGGRIVTVGRRLEDLGPWMARAARKGIAVRIDRTFAEDVIVPGFVEPHIHPIIGGIALQLPSVAYHPTPRPGGDDIPGCRSKAEVLTRLAARAADLDARGDGSDLLAWGWDAVALGDAKGPARLTREDLDAISTTRVIAVWDASMHNGFTNSAGLARIGLLRGDSWLAAWRRARARRIPGVGVGVGGADFTGEFFGIQALYLLRPLFAPCFEVRRLVRAQRFITALASEGGITTMVCPAHVQRRVFAHLAYETVQQARMMMGRMVTPSFIDSLRDQTLTAP